MPQPQTFALILMELLAMVLAISLHDSAQAWMANRLGDPTARMLGRISMNPAVHFDPFGMAIWPLLYVFFSPLILGWGKPVPTTYRNFRSKNGEMLSILAGPAAQLLAAGLCLAILVVLKHTVPGVAESLKIAEQLAFRESVGADGLPAIFPVMLFLYTCILVNLLLCVFNMLPIPFVDGGKILIHFLPYNAAKSFEQYSMYIMIAFFFVGFRLIMLVFAPLLTVFDALLALL